VIGFDEVELILTFFYSAYNDYPLLWVLFEVVIGFDVEAFPLFYNLANLSLRYISYSSYYTLLKVPSD